MLSMNIRKVALKIYLGFAKPHIFDIVFKNDVIEKQTKQCVPNSAFRVHS